METKQSEFVSLDSLAATLNLPRAFLRRQADAETIPCLIVGGRRRFHVESVSRSLIDQAASKARKAVSDAE